jgi:hypothetical protein
VLLYSSIVSIFGISATLVFNETAMCVGRFVWGICCGLFSSVNPRCVDDTVPPYLLSKYGIVINAGGMLGEMIAMLMGAVLP